MYQTMSYEAQLEMKERQIRELLEKALPDKALDGVWEGIRRSPQNLLTATRWSFPLGMSIRTVPFSGTSQKGKHL